MSHASPLSLTSVRRRRTPSLAVAAALGLAPVVGGAQVSGDWGYRGVFAKQEVGAVSSAGAYVGSPPGHKYCGYAEHSLVPTVGVERLAACSPSLGTTTVARSVSQPGQPLRATASVRVEGTTLAGGLTGGYTSYAIASQAIQVGVAALGSAPATVAVFVNITGSFLVEPVDELPGVGLGQATVTMGHNTAPSYAGATYERLHFSSLTAAASATGGASFAGAVTPVSPTAQAVAGVGRFDLPVSLGTNYYLLELLTLAFAANPAPSAGPTSVSAAADFGNSARIVGLQAFDALGRDVTHETQFTFVGEDVPLGAPALVPEPATLALVGGGLLALGAIARRRRTI